MTLRPARVKPQSPCSSQGVIDRFGENRVQGNVHAAVEAHFPSASYSLVLAIIAAGLRIWALTIQSDLDGAQQELDAATQDVEAPQAEGDAGNRTGAVLAGGAEPLG